MLRARGIEQSVCPSVPPLTRVCGVPQKLWFVTAPWRPGHTSAPSLYLVSLSSLCKQTHGRNGKHLSGSLWPFLCQGPQAWGRSLSAPFSASTPQALKRGGGRGGAATLFPVPWLVVSQKPGHVFDEGGWRVRPFCILTWRGNAVSHPEAAPDSSFSGCLGSCSRFSESSSCPETNQASPSKAAQVSAASGGRPGPAVPSAGRRAPLQGTWLPLGGPAPRRGWIRRSATLDCSERGLGEPATSHGVRRQLGWVPEGGGCPQWRGIEADAFQV